MHVHIPLIVFFSNFSANSTHLLKSTSSSPLTLPLPSCPSPYLHFCTSSLSSAAVSAPPLVSQTAWCSNICGLHSNRTDISPSQSVHSSPQTCSFLPLSTPPPLQNPSNLVPPPARSLLLHHNSTKSHSPSQPTSLNTRLNFGHACSHLTSLSNLPRKATFTLFPL